MSWFSDIKSVTKARKSHQCCYCLDEIEKGTSYLTWFYKDHFGHMTMNAHRFCHDFYAKRMDDHQFDIDCSYFIDMLSDWQISLGIYEEILEERFRSQ